MLSTLSSFYDLLGLVSPFILRGGKILQDHSQEGLQRRQKYIKGNGNTGKIISLD